MTTERYEVQERRFGKRYRTILRTDDLSHAAWFFRYAELPCAYRVLDQGKLIVRKTPKEWSR